MIDTHFCTHMETFDLLLMENLYTQYPFKTLNLWNCNKSADRFDLVIKIKNYRLAKTYCQLTICQIHRQF